MQKMRENQVLYSQRPLTHKLAKTSEFKQNLNSKIGRFWRAFKFEIVLTSTSEKCEEIITLGLCLSSSMGIVMKNGPTTTQNEYVGVYI